MAHLEVEPKPARPWWVWLLVALILIALAALLLKNCNSDKTGVADSTKDTTSAPIAATVPDWKSVDFNSAVTTDSDITDKDIVIRGGTSYTIYTLGENILFPTDGDAISPAGQEKLKMISAILSKRFNGATIGVFGSTDSRGSADHNEELGQKRAEAVKNWLSTSGNIASETISVQSLGESEPVATNQTKDGRQQNRNVAIVVFPKQ